MRTTLILKDELIQKAKELTGIKEKTAVVHAALEALIEKHSRERLRKLAGTQKKLQPIPRRNS
ncbi:MAG: type II toxin-antitoxin system VapB family antitoxin [Halobacteriovoraceae bacterium]|nr:type II toxin-antitoxin system VapB family antitoxin [Halobacteriovoraceae bacterium]